MSTQPNLFEAFGDKVPIPHKRAREKQAAKSARAEMVKTGLEKKQEEKAKQLIRYREWKREVREGITRGDFGVEIVELLKILRRPTQTEMLITYVLDSKWIMKCPLHARETMLGYIDEMLIRFNVRNGYPPFNDPLTDDEPMTQYNRMGYVFRKIRKKLTGV